jgi:hypothetical protein
MCASCSTTSTTISSRHNHLFDFIFLLSVCVKFVLASRILGHLLQRFRNVLMPLVLLMTIQTFIGTWQQANFFHHVRVHVHRFLL